AGPDGRRRHGGAVRGARRAEDPERAIAPAARPAGSRGRPALRLRAGGAAGRAVQRASGRRGDVMRRLWTIVGATIMLLGCAGPAGAERLVTSLSNYRISIASNFTGADLVLFGTIDREPSTPQRPRRYDLVQTGTVPRQHS